MRSSVPNRGKRTKDTATTLDIASKFAPTGRWVSHSLPY
jgi:hypothetical protein